MENGTETNNANGGAKPQPTQSNNLRLAAIAGFFILAIMVGYVVANPNAVSSLTGVSGALGCHGGTAAATAPVVATTAAAQASPDAQSSPQNSAGSVAQSSSPSAPSADVQEVRMDVLQSGWSPNSFVVKKGVRVKWIINAKQLTGCNNEILVRDYNIDVKLKQGENIIEFTPDKVGTVQFSCWMGMLKGNFIVVDDTANQTAVSQAVASAPAPKTGGCGCGEGGSTSCSR